MGNPVTRFQILSKTPDETAAFYAALFDWSVDADNALGYRQFEMDSSEGIRGGVWPSPPDGQTFVQLFVSVPDIAAKVAEAEKLGARLVMPPTPLPDGDEMAVLLDPTGLAFGIWRAGADRS